MGNNFHAKFANFMPKPQKKLKDQSLIILCSASSTFFFMGGVCLLVYILQCKSSINLYSTLSTILLSIFYYVNKSLPVYANRVLVERCYHWACLKCHFYI